MPDPASTVSTLVLGGAEALSRLEEAVCGLPPVASPARAEGLAAAGAHASSLGRTPCVLPIPTEINATCVHHALSDTQPPRGTACAFAPGDGQEALDLAIAARLVSGVMGRPVLCLHGAYSRETARLTLPLPVGWSERPEDDDAEPLAAAAAETVAAATGRSVTTVRRAGPEGAPFAIVGAGVAGRAAERLAAAIRDAGQPCSSVSVTLVRPAPIDALGEALAGAKHSVLLIDFDDGDLLQLAALREAAPDAASTSVTVPATAPVVGLLAAVGAHLPFAPPVVKAEPAETTFQVTVVPHSDWAIDVARGIAGRLMPPGHSVAVSSRGPGGGGAVLIGPAHQSTRRVLVAADARNLTGAVVDTLQDDDVVVVHGRGDGDIDRIDAAARSKLSARGIAVRIVYAEPDEGAAWSAGRLIDAAAAAAADADHDALQEVAAAALAGEDETPEVDFRSAPGGPAGPTTEPALEHSPGWLRQFHLGRAGRRPPGPPLAPAAVGALARSEAPRWPAVLTRDDGVLAVGTLADAVASALPRADVHQLARVEHQLRAQLKENDATVANLRELAGQAAPAAWLEGDGLEAIPADARAVCLHDAVALELAIEVLQERAAEARARLDDRLGALRERLADLLDLDRMRSSAGRSADALGSALGGMPLVDPSKLAATLPEPEPSSLLPELRRRRLEGVAEVLDAFSPSASLPPSTLVVPRDSGVELPPTPGHLVTHEMPLQAALGLFDGFANVLADVVRAARTAELELDDAWRADVHGPALEDLDWEGFTPDELAALPQIVVAVPASHVRGTGAAALQGVLRSGRPIRVLVVDDGLDSPDEYHARPAWQAIAHREAFVVGGSAARPDRWVEGVSRAAGSVRPALLEFWLPDPGPSDWRELRAAAAVAGRTCPDLVYDPDGGADQADRLDASGNAAPGQAWPSFEVAVAEGDPIQVPLTHADALSLDPRWRDSFRLLDPEDEAADQLPIDAWIDQLDPSSPQPWLPYLSVVHAGAIRRAVPTRELAMACADRLRGWHAVQEAAGFDNAWAHRAAEAAFEQANVAAATEIAALRAEHVSELEQVRATAAREALSRVAQALLDAGSGALVIGGGGAAPEPIDAPDNGAPEPIAAVAPPAEEPEEDDAPIVEEAYIDTVLCTTCNECTNMNGRMFKYDGNKQAFIADIEAGTFAELVKAAELCPAACIHPGPPRSGDGTVTDDLVARAAAFN